MPEHSLLNSCGSIKSTRMTWIPRTKQLFQQNYPILRLCIRKMHWESWQDPLYWDLVVTDNCVPRMPHWAISYQYRVLSSGEDQFVVDYESCKQQANSKQAAAQSFQCSTTDCKQRLFSICNFAFITRNAAIFTSCRQTKKFEGIVLVF